MKVTVTTVYDRITNPGIFAFLSHGLSFYIGSEKDKIMFDLGLLGGMLMKNMGTLGISANTITKIVFSHGHSDHTGGLNAFLAHRTKKTVIPIYMHPKALEPKRAHIGKLRLWDTGMYQIEPALERKIKFIFSREPIVINSFLMTTGEISLENRTFIQNVSKYYVHFCDSKWSVDPVIDEVSLILKTKEGLVLICGCCHSGLSNTIRKAETLVNDKVLTVIGGVHLTGARRKKILEIADELDQNYTDIAYFFNHSIGKLAFKTLRKRLGETRVNYAPFGKTFIFDC